MSKEESGDIIIGKNAVMEAFRSNVTIEKLFLQEGLKDSTISTVLREAKKNNTVYYFVSRERLDSLSNGKHQGIVAKITKIQYASIDDIFENAKSRNEDPFIFLLDGIEDPHNVGAIIRTAEICGVHGICVLKRHAAPISEIVIKSSAGAAFTLPIVKVSNMTQTINELKERGVWVAASDMDGQVMYETNLTGSIALVIGNEGSGVSSLVKKNCDYIVSIPMFGKMNSLNASVAAGVLGYEIVRQRINKNV